MAPALRGHAGLMRPAGPPLDRVAVIGTSGVGKTTFAAALAKRRGAAHIELDQLQWNPEWTPTPAPEFRARVADALSADRWVCDGNYASVRDLVWGNATALVWLNFPFPRIFARLVVRTVRRSLSRERVCGDNRESLSRALTHPDSILLWAIQSHPRNLRELPAARAADYPQLPLIELRRARDAERLLRELD